MTCRLPRLKRALCVLKLTAATLALVGRLLSGMAVADPRALGETAALLAATVACHADTGTAGGQHDAPTEPGPGLAVLVSLLSQPPPILTPAVLAPPPRESVLTVATVLPPARAPPVRTPGAALPRGPPTLA